MDLDNSKNINNQLKNSTILIAIITHLILAVLTFGVSVALSIITGLVTLLLLKKDINKANSRENRFNKNYPFAYFGETFCRFHHFFITPTVSIKTSIARLH